MKFFRCKHCGNIIAYVEDSGVKVVCCGEVMQELIPSSTDAAVEKHVPVYTVDGNLVKVKVGSVAHPMIESHYISFIAISTNFGNQRKVLKAGQSPEACFALCDGEKVEEVYAYCNIHGLWKA